MTPELTALTCAGLLQLVQFVLFAVPANLELGPAKTMGPRDDGQIQGQLSVGTSRLGRALSNHFESLILFTLAVVVITLSDQSTALTRTCAWVYVVARVLYIPAYYFGLVPWRSVIWGVGFAAITVMLLGTLV